MSRDHLVATIRQQADACGQLGSPLYRDLLDRVAGDVAAGGPAARVLAGHEDDPGPSGLALRLTGTVHRLVLAGEAPTLAVHYPSAGGTPGRPAEVWAAFRAVLEDHPAAVRRRLDQPPQTNEVGRAAALLGGLLHVAARFDQPVRLLELGASGGLNLRADRFRYEHVDGSAWGPPDSPVVLHDAWRGPSPPLHAALRVMERRGTDVAPLDPATPEGALTLLSYVWPDQLERLRRLRGALTVAAEVPATLVRASARAAVESLQLVDGRTTVVWHSVMWQYLENAERAAVLRRLDELGSEATRDRPLAHLALEPRRPARAAPHEFMLTLQTWPGEVEVVLGIAQPHGPPVDWRPAG